MAPVGRRNESALEALDRAQLSGGVAGRALGDNGGMDVDHAISFDVVVPSVFDDTQMRGATGASTLVRRPAT